MNRLALFSTLLVLASYCHPQLSIAPLAVAQPLPLPKAWGFDLTGMDRSVVPGDDFYAFANGGWTRRTEIPADRTTVGSFPDLRYEANANVQDLLEHNEQATSVSSSAQKATALYRAYMDEGAVARLGDAPLHRRLDRLRKVRSKNGLAASMGSSFSGFGSSLFRLEISYDDKDPQRYAVHLGQGGLGLPSREYYLQPQFAAAKDAYQKYVANLLRLSGWSDATQQAKAIVAFETAVAEGSWNHGEERDPVKTYNPEAVSALERSIPAFDWNSFFDGAGLHDLDRIVLTTNTSIPKLAQVFASTSLKTLTAWQAFHTADGAAPYMSEPFVQAHFEFHTHILGGQPVLAPRWIRAVGFVNEAMGSAVGQLYIERYYPKDNQQQMEALVANLRAALQDRLEHLAWMSEPTKVEALRKLTNLEIQIGRPKEWIDYGNLKVSPRCLYDDAQRERAFDWRRRVTQMHGPWNKSDWRFWPQYPTAYTENNQLIFTAAMLQAPFFNPKADPAVNYGGIGAVIGHELTHSFDDQGRETDATNRLRNWWTPEDAVQFKEHGDRLSQQYSAMEPLPGLHIKGNVTLGENIADLGGMTIALDAYRTSLHNQPPPVLDGFTGEQRFFLGWAQIWREKRREDSLRQLITSDVHSPVTARVNGVVRNMDTWYDRYTIEHGQTLYLSPAERVRIW